MIEFYTDGGCEPNPGKGCWSFVCVNPHHESSGFELNTTSNRMELTAVIKTIEYASENNLGIIKIFSDSQYAVKGFTRWMHGWANYSWCTWINKKNPSDFYEVKNKDLWQTLFKYRDKAVLQWVRGHNGNKFNELADELVRSKYTEMFGGVMRY